MLSKLDSVMPGEALASLLYAARALLRVEALFETAQTASKLLRFHVWQLAAPRVNLDAWDTLGARRLAAQAEHNFCFQSFSLVSLHVPVCHLDLGAQLGFPPSRGARPGMVLARGGWRGHAETREGDSLCVIPCILCSGCALSSFRVFRVDISAMMREYGEAVWEPPRLCALGQARPLNTKNVKSNPLKFSPFSHFYYELLSSKN